MNRRMGKLGGALLSAWWLALVGCSDSDSVSGIEGTGGPETTEATGSVTGYSSIVVNGERYDIGTADIEINGEAGALEEAIELGMVVHIRAELDPDDQSARALEVSYDRMLRGPIDQVEEVDVTRKQLQVLGQVLVVQDDIVFAGLSFETLTEGETIAVSGFVDAQGRLVASRIASAAGDAELDLEGLVANLDVNQQTFTLGELSVDYTNALFVGGSRDDLSSGQRVELKGGERDDQGVLAPSEVHIDSRPPVGREGEPLSLEGVVGEFEGAGSFRIQGVRVNASQAQLLDGAPGDLRSGVRLVVAGQMLEGELQAERVRLLLPGITRVRAQVEEVNSEAGELTLLGNRYRINPLTGFEDRSAQANRFITLGAIATGDLVEVFARYLGDELVATRVRRLEAEGGAVTLRGPVTGVDSDSLFSVMGVSVDAGEAQGGALVSALARGDMVEVAGELSGTGAMVASSVSVPDIVPCPGAGNGPGGGEGCDQLPDLFGAGAGEPVRVRF